MKLSFPAFLFAAFTACSSAWAKAPEVVASVKPVYAIAKEVMSGVGVPSLLLANADSPHSYALKPSGARVLSRADVIFWIGPLHETFLIKPLSTLAGKATVVGLLAAPGVDVLSVRTGGVWEGETSVEEAVPDTHIWLNPVNAIVLANVMADTLAVADPTHATEYWANAQTFSKAAMEMDRNIHLRLGPVREKPFLVFHDAYQYFEKRYRLKAIGSISVTPDQPPGARRLAAIQEKLSDVGPVCVFAEPGFEPRYVTMLAEDSGARIGMLDPEGTKIEDGPGLYFRMIDSLADEVQRCLR